MTATEAPTNPLFADREAWLTEAASIILDGIIAPHLGDAPAPSIRLSLGFPKHTRGRKVIAQAFPRAVSSAGLSEVFVSPEIDDPAVILPVLTAALISASLDCQHDYRHKGRFAELAQACGLEAPYANPSAGAWLKAELATLADALGVFPHARLDMDAGHQKQATRQLKVYCPNQSCGFLARSSLRQLLRWHRNAPHCPCCGTRLVFPAEVSGE